MVSIKKNKVSNVWPIDPLSKKSPKNWPGWPKGNNFAIILTHDVDTQRGHDRCTKLLTIEKNMGFKSSFNFVPERYEVSDSLRKFIVKNGFEVGVHGLNHDGKLYQSRDTFKKRAKSINKYIKKWNSVGFRSPAMHHNLEWIHDLEIEYDLSTFDTDPFEPQPDGVGTIFPFRVVSTTNASSYIEMPYTLCQDFTLFILLGEKDTKIWEEKADWIIQNQGMILLNTHPGR